MVSCFILVITDAFFAEKEGVKIAKMKITGDLFFLCKKENQQENESYDE